MLEEVTALYGNKREKAIQCLKKAGWYPRRITDITVVEEFYQQMGILLTESAKAVFQEFYGLAQEWYFNEDDISWRGGDYMFRLFPFQNSERLKGNGRSVYQNEVEAIAGELLTYIGWVGYYYPSGMFVAESGKLWRLTPNHKMLCFKDMFDLVACDFYENWNTVAMRQTM